VQAVPKKRTDFGSMSRGDLEKRLTELKSEAFNLRFQRATGKLENFRRIREVKRDIARVMMFMSLKGGEK
jgi:large subunit ribosomal protein L29